MNKTNIDKALRVLDAQLAAGRPGDQPTRNAATAPAPPGKGPPPAAPAVVRALPARRLPGADEFPPGVHPDDWEPDWEDEPESARAIARLANAWQWHRP